MALFETSSIPYTILEKEETEKLLLTIQVRHRKRGCKANINQRESSLATGTRISSSSFASVLYILLRLSTLGANVRVLVVYKPRPIFINPDNLLPK